MKSNYSVIWGHLRAGLLIGACGIALSGISVYAQTPTETTNTNQNTNTSQTDQSEEDWRKSRKKRDTTDIFDDITNTGSIGRGGFQTGPINPVDSLPDQSRRHLNKQRAKAMAEAPIGAPVNTDFIPSAEAQSDSDLEEQEKLAWSEMMSDVNAGMGMNTGTAQGGSTTQNSDNQGQNQGQGENSAAADASEQSSNSSLMRGGSSASVADILAKIKGNQTAQGTSAENTDTNPQDRQGTQQSEASTNAATESGSSEGKPAEGKTAEAEGSSGAESSQTTEGSDNPDNASDTQAETMGPLERAQSDRSRTTGNRTSASDYLNRFKKKKNEPRGE